MAAPSMVFTAHFAARHFGVDLDVIEAVAEEMTPEDGCGAMRIRRRSAKFRFV